MKKSLFALLTVLVLSACGNDPEVPPYGVGMGGGVGVGGPGQMGGGCVGMPQAQGMCPPQIINDYNLVVSNCNAAPMQQACRVLAQRFTSNYGAVSCVAPGLYGQNIVINNAGFVPLLGQTACVGYGGGQPGYGGGQPGYGGGRPGPGYGGGQPGYGGGPYGNGQGQAYPQGNQQQPLPSNGQNNPGYQQGNSQQQQQAQGQGQYQQLPLAQAPNNNGQANQNQGQAQGQQPGQMTAQ